MTKTSSPIKKNRRDFLRDLGVSAAVAPLLGSLTSLGQADQTGPTEAAADRYVQPQRDRAQELLA
jgi:hypothetical protein